MSHICLLLLYNINKFDHIYLYNMNEDQKSCNIKFQNLKKNFIRRLKKRKKKEKEKRESRIDTYKGHPTLYHIPMSKCNVFPA